MSKLTEKEREGFEAILGQDLTAINAKLMEQIKNFWGLARIEVQKRKGWDKLLVEKEKLNDERKNITARIHEIENTMNKEDLLPEQIVEMGGRPNEFGRYGGAAFYGIPVTSQFEYEIAQYIKTNIDLEIPAKIIKDVCSASLRALTMAGTFEEAREAYNKFYSLDFRKYGVDIPPRLDDVKKDVKAIEYAGQKLEQIDSKSVNKVLTDRRESK